MIIAKETIINVFNSHRIATYGDVNAAARAASKELGQDETTVLSVVLESLSVSKTDTQSVSNSPILA